LRTFLASLAVLLAAMPAAAQAPFEARSAYHEDGALWFTAPDAIDWESRAPAEIRDLEIPTRDPEIVARYADQVDRYGGVEVRLAVPVPQELAAGHTYFVRAEGVAPVLIDSVLVVTRLELDFQETAILERRSGGLIYGRAERRSGAGGGFVVDAVSPLSFRAMPSSLSADRRDRLPASVRSLRARRERRCLAGGLDVLRVRRVSRRRGGRIGRQNGSHIRARLARGWPCP
jgi:hypothetical protein